MLIFICPDPYSLLIGFTKEEPKGKANALLVASIEVGMIT